MLQLPLRPGRGVLAVPLGIRLCWTHRLPKRGWTGLQDRALLDALRRITAPRSFAIEGAWVQHVRASRARG